MKRYLVSLLLISCIILSACDFSSENNSKIEKPALKYKEIKLHDINSKIYSSETYYIELTPGGIVYKCFYDTNNSMEILSSPDIIDISCNNSIAFLYRDGKITLYYDNDKKQEDIGFVPNATSLTHLDNNSKNEQCFYVLTKDNDLYIKGEFAGGELGNNKIISKNEFVKVAGIPEIKKIRTNYLITTILTKDGRIFTQGDICNNNKDIFEERKFNVPIVDFADGVENIIALDDNGNAYQYGNVNSGVANKMYSDMVKVSFVKNVEGISGFNKKEYAICSNGEIVFWGNIYIKNINKSETQVYHTDKIKPFKNPEVITTSQDVMFVRDNDKVYYIYID